MKKSFHNLSVIQKITIVPVLIVFLAALTALWLYHPLFWNAGSSNGYACTRGHIYLPTRLDFKGCKTVTGTVSKIKIEKDGDYHVRFELDSQYKNLLTSQNYKRQDGKLVVEDMCRRNPKTPIEILARITCYHYTSPFPEPIVGARYEVTGNYVVDDWHGSWAEIHGLSEFKQIK